MGIAGVLIALSVLVALAYRGWSILLLAPLCAMLAALLAGQPVLANWTQTFMRNAADFVAQFFPIFLLGALFGKLMESSGSVEAIAAAMTEKLGSGRAILAVVLAGAFVTYGGVSLFVAFFVLAPMGHAVFKAADIPHRLMPASIALGTSTFTMSAMPGTPAIQNAIPMPFFGTNSFAAPGLGIIASAIMFGFGMWWLERARRSARLVDDTYRYSGGSSINTVSSDDTIRERGAVAHDFDPREIERGGHAAGRPSFLIAALPLLVVVTTNLIMSFAVLPRIDAGFLAEPRWGATSLSAVAGVWSVIVALFAGIVILVFLNLRRLTGLRAVIDAGASAAVLPMLSVASLVGFGAVVAALPAFDQVKGWVLGIEGGPLVSLAVATNILAALTGSASGGLTIALDALGPTYMDIAAKTGLNPELMHRVAVIGAGTLDSLPHNGAVVTLLAVCGVSHKDGYLDLAMAAIASALVALVFVIAIGSLFGSF
ncbi:GntP family permease [Rhizobium cauense]|uniref:GntP family permease n=1 Tax=Rhizobium cauense TaxID=1166683 RepID=UPI001C6E8EC0|nr:GntP family permease [Rhizobium cauense]MBW9116504.1 GntP family permease [Rhizobium cauense]